MYLSVENCFKLDEIVKSFEVAYRSYISNTIKDNLPSLNEFSVEINKLNASFEKSSIISSNKFKSKIEKIKNEISKYYQLIETSNQSFLTKDYPNADVPYVSDLLDFVYLFYSKYFNNVSAGFATIEEFKDYSSKYHLIRNHLSHPASNFVLLQHAHEVIVFIKRLLNNIGDDYFWYVTKKKIAKIITEFSDGINQIPLKIYNIDNINFKHHKVICREPEIETLKNLIFGKDENYRKSGSIVVYGYGGVGKTALVLEFIFNVIKRLFDEKKNDLDFILFYSAKEEGLSFSETTGKLYINEINKQFSSFKDFKENLLNDLGIKKDEDLKNYRGIVAIDNIETISDADKKEIYEFIKKSPRSIQYLITSRNEEPCEDKLNLKEFRDHEIGKLFIDEFIETNGLNISLEIPQKIELIDSSKGNALIIVLSLMLMRNGSSFQEISYDLKSVESGNLNVIADFMYKNTLNQAISQLETDGYKPVDILKVISLYQVPIDLYSLSSLSNGSIIDTEHICNLLASKLILEKNQESYNLNEFADKFVLIKYLPNKIERKDLQDKIKNYRSKLTEQLEKLEFFRSLEPRLNHIIEDWKPKNSIDKIAIAETFSLFGEAKKAIEKRYGIKIESIKKDFDKNERMTSHPYVKYQKARTYELLLKNKSGIIINRENILQIISKSYEEAIEAIDFYYPYIKNTLAYGAINCAYGLFILRDKRDPSYSLRFLEEACEIFKRLNVKDVVYYNVLSGLSYAYIKCYGFKRDRRYREEFIKIFNEFVSDKEQIIKSGFNYEVYLQRFSGHAKHKK